MILNHRLKSDNEKKAIAVTKQYGELPMVDCYPSQLNQVLMNILANAIEALEKQPDPEIAIATEVKQDFVNIRIKDNGPGIPQALQPQILDPFFTTKPIGKGTGMGMSISYQIITEKHGGQLVFASEVGK
ncbi:MAG: ATP-binding protein, partial [Cyanobacteria bacterium J06648_10]